MRNNRVAHKYYAYARSGLKKVSTEAFFILEEQKETELSRLSVSFFWVAPQVGLEPTTLPVAGACSIL
jgi:hypothetical protein